MTVTLSANQDVIEYLESIELSLRSDKLKLAKILVGEGLVNQDFIQGTVSNLVAQSFFNVKTTEKSKNKQTYSYVI